MICRACILASKRKWMYLRLFQIKERRELLCDCDISLPDSVEASHYQPAFAIKDLEVSDDLPEHTAWTAK